MVGTRSQGKRKPDPDPKPDPKPNPNKGKQREIPESPAALGPEGIAQAEREEGGSIPPTARDIARHLPIVREADWRAAPDGQERDTWQKRTAFVLQRRGDVFLAGCGRCQAGEGERGGLAFASCVVAPALGGAAFVRGACANCLWDNRQGGCSLRGRFVLDREGISQYLDEGEYNLRRAIAKEAAGVQESEEEEYVEESEGIEAEAAAGNRGQDRPPATARVTATFFGAFMPGRAFARVGHSQRGPRCFFDGDELRFPISRQIWASPRRLHRARSDLAHFAAVVDARLFEMGRGQGGDDYLFWRNEARRLPGLYRPPCGTRRGLPLPSIESSSDDSAPPGDGVNTSFDIHSSFQSIGKENRPEPGPSGHRVNAPLPERDEIPDSQPSDQARRIQGPSYGRNDGVPGPSRQHRPRPRNLLDLPNDEPTHRVPASEQETIRATSPRDGEENTLRALYNRRIRGSWDTFPGGSTGRTMPKSMPPVYRSPALRSTTATRRLGGLDQFDYQAYRRDNANAAYPVPSATQTAEPRQTAYHPPAIPESQNQSQSQDLQYIQAPNTEPKTHRTQTPPQPTQSYERPSSPTSAIYRAPQPVRPVDAHRLLPNGVLNTEVEVEEDAAVPASPMQSPRYQPGPSPDYTPSPSLVYISSEPEPEPEPGSEGEFEPVPAPIHVLAPAPAPVPVQIPVPVSAPTDRGSAPPSYDSHNFKPWVTNNNATNLADAEITRIRRRDEDGQEDEDGQRRQVKRARTRSGRVYGE